MLDPLVRYIAAPFASPFAISALLADGIVAANLPFEGLWVPVAWGKWASVELTGSISSLSLDIYGTNQAAPLNTYTVTVGGSETDGDVLSLTFTNPLLPAGSKTVSHTTTGGESLSAIATALAAAVNADADLKTLGFLATPAAAVVTIQWPSLPGTGPATSVSSPPGGSSTILTKTLSGGASETLTIAAGTDGTNLTPSHLTALGLTNLSSSMPVGWIKARVGTLTGTNAVVSAALAAAA